MEFSVGIQGRAEALASVFETSFAASEGAEEGRVLYKLAMDLMETTRSEDLYVFSMADDGALIGSIMFSRIRYDMDPRKVFILSPVAVVPKRQREGIGQALLKFGLEALRTEGVDIALTYGNPHYYAKVGFRQITADDAAPPFPLGQPHGWLGQSLTGEPFSPLKGPSKCVPGFDDPAHW